MMCHRCLLLDRSEMTTVDENGWYPSTEVGSAVTILNGEALCSRHWQDATEQTRESAWTARQ